MPNEMLPQYGTLTFTQVWDDKDKFLEDYSASGIPALITTNNATTLYYLLYAKHGNDPIANLDVNQFKAKVFSTIFQYGPTWEKKLDIQSKLRSLTDDELLIGSKAIYNSALNPSTAPSTSSLDELAYINSQNTTNYKRSKMEAYNMLWEALRTDVTSAFIKRFDHCFKTFVLPERPLLYVSEDEGEEI